MLEVRPRGKLFVACLTDIGFLTSVYTLMPNQVGHLGKSLVATYVLATVWFLLIVDASVLLERRILCKGLVAQITTFVSKLLLERTKSRYLL